MTLRELAAAAAEKKTPPSGLRLTMEEPQEATGFEPSDKLKRAVKSFQPTNLGPLDRPLGTDNGMDVIPMDEPTATPEKLWREARHAPVNQLCVILSDDGKRAWISLVAPGQPPLLLYMLPVLGRLDLRSGEGWVPQPLQQKPPVWKPTLDPMDPQPPPWQPLPHSLISPGTESSEINDHSSQLATAPSVGLDGAEPCEQERASAPET